MRRAPALVFCGLALACGCHHGDGAGAPRDLLAAGDLGGVGGGDLLGADLSAAPSSWTNLGINAAAQADGTKTERSLSGRVNTIRLDPADADAIYIAVSGGGVWRGGAMSTAAPLWTPLGDTLATTMIGAIDVDRNLPKTLFAGLGEPLVVPPGALVPSAVGAVAKSLDGGAHWLDAVALAGAYPTAAGGGSVRARAVRDLRVDPSNGSVVFVASDVGLFRSSDGGASFVLLDLPNAGPADLEESIWSLVYVGQSGQSSAWVVSGQYKNAGNLGDVWRSADSGSTWTSLRVNGAFPIPNGELQRITLAAGATTAVNKTVLFGMVEGGATPDRTADLWRSLDGGATFTSVMTTVKPIAGCGSLNVGATQSGYNQAVLVDPTDANHVLIGGEVCSLRTLTGLTDPVRWAFSSAPDDTQWYVHPDWHAAAAVATASGLRVFGGTDGGVYTSTNLFTVAEGLEQSTIAWQDRNTGLPTQELYSIASGQLADGNAGVLFGGLQDDGTLFRREVGSNLFFHVLGGDGSGAAISHGAAGDVFFGVHRGAGLFSRSACFAASADCTLTTSWVDAPVTLPAGDVDAAYGIRLSNIASDAAGAILTNTTYNVWRGVPGNGQVAWTNLSGTQCAGAACTSGNFKSAIVDVTASATTGGLFAVALANGRVAVTTNGDQPSPTWNLSAPIGAGGLTAIVDSVALPASANPKTVAASTARANALGGAPLPAGFAHLFLSQDGGASWQGLAGLPDVPVRQVRFDPRDASAQSIYAATAVGVYVTADGGHTWTRLGSGLPNVPITDLYISRDGNLVRVATYGRGFWEL